MIESREDDISYFQTDEINGSQSNRKKTASKELAEYSKMSEAEKGLLFNVTPDLSMTATAKAMNKTVDLASGSNM